MEVKVGQWVRKGRHIGVITKVYVGGYDIRCNTLIRPFNYVDSTYYEDWNVANTPQELVQDKDLVEIEGKIEEVKDYKNWSKKDKNNITKILTPNSNGGYDLQWSGENDELKARNQD